METDHKFSQEHSVAASARAGSQSCSPIPETHQRFISPATVIQRVVNRNRRLPPPLPRDWEPQDEPWWWDWYRRGIELNRARSPAALGTTDESRRSGR